MKIRINIKNTMLVLCGVVLFLAIAHLVVHWLRIYQGWDIPGSYRYAVFALFDLGGEVSIPTWYSQTLLLAAAALTFIVSKAQIFAKKDQKYWIGIACVLLYMSIDEGASVHESFGYIVRNNIVEVTSGVFYFSWLPVGLALVAIFVLVYGSFWLRQSKKIMFLLALSAGVFLGGAVGMEMLASYLVGSGSQSFFYYVVEALEESMEMLGVIIFIYTMLDLLRSKKKDIQLKLSVK